MGGINQMGKIYSEKNRSYHEVNTEEELLEKMQDQEFYILIKDDLNEKVKKLLRTRLSDEELMGAELGSAGTNSLLSEIIYKVITMRQIKSETERKLLSKIRQYNFKMKDEEILL